jgi:hypothetical protein
VIPHQQQTSERKMKKKEMHRAHSAEDNEFS